MMEGDSIVIWSNRLRVEIAAPGSVYSGSRFDWSGFITQVTLDDAHTFCMPESLVAGEGTGGIGLCNEFGNDLPVGYADASPGEKFSKLGIGTLRRDEGPYQFFRPYPIVDQYPIQVQIAENQATFILEPVLTNGYGARLTKTVSVVGQTLKIAYHLSNVGEKPILTNEYCHNFVGIDKHTVGPDYRLRFAFKPVIEETWQQFRGLGPKWMRILPRGFTDRMLKRRFDQMQSILQFTGSDLVLSQVPTSPFYARLLGFERTDHPQWELVHRPSGLGMREYVDFTPVRIAIWGVSHVISAEVFVGIDLEPDQAMQWSRRYEFFTSED